MERIKINSIKAGQRFEQSLFTASGQKLLNCNVILTERHVQALWRCGDADLLLADTIEELMESGIVTRFDSSKLKVGQRSETGIISNNGQVLVEAGQEIEEHHLDALAAGGKAFVSRQQSQTERRERILMADAMVEDLLQESKRLDIRVKPWTGSDWITPADSAAWPKPDELTAVRAGHVETLRQCYARIEAGVPVFLAEFEPLIDNLVARFAKFPTRFTQLALLCPRREDYLPDHAYTVTILTMAIAGHLRWPVEDVRRIGLAGLLFDLGMLMVPERIRSGACQLTDIDRSRVQRHPVFSLAMLQVVDAVEPIIQLTALQHHERENGSGYPHGTRRDGTCDYARVLAVADSFAATTEPRHYRKQKLPYAAMEETLRSTSAMAFWKPAMRALVQAAGLFPVGSFVKLSDGVNAHVLASNPKQLDRPLVQPLDPEGKPKGAPVDLAAMAPANLSVVRPMPGPTG